MNIQKELQDEEQKGEDESDVVPQLRRRFCMMRATSRGANLRIEAILSRSCGFAVLIDTTYVLYFVCSGRIPGCATEGARVPSHYE